MKVENCFSPKPSEIVSVFHTERIYRDSIFIVKNNRCLAVLKLRGECSSDCRMRYRPLEDGKVTISRAAGTLTFPAEFTVVAAAWRFFVCRCAAQVLGTISFRLAGR
jgi:hypothetical protein